MKKLMISFLVLAVAFAGLAVAKEDNPKTLKGPAGMEPEMVQLLYSEGFEGAFPPAGWTHTITNPGYTWFQSTTAYAGLYGAHINWQDASYQNEVLSFQRTIDVAGGESYLTFATMGSPFWAANADFTVRINGTTVWSFLNDFAGGTFVWGVRSVDLAAYDGQFVTIAFVYEGNDGADHHLDSVVLGEAPPPPPPPPSNNLCENAIDLQAQGLTSFQVDLCQASNSYNAGAFSPSCTGYTSNGNDVVYKIYLTAGENLTVSQQGTHDSSLWVGTDCSDLAGTCVAGADVTFSGGIETVSFAAPFTGWYYIVIDGWSSCSLTTVWVDAPVGTQDQSWSSVKTLYR